MPRLLPALLWPVLTLGLLLFPPQIHAADPWQGKVVGVVDGATLDVAKSDGQVERVRLFAIGVPAPGKPKPMRRKGGRSHGAANGEKWPKSGRWDMTVVAGWSPGSS